MHRLFQGLESLDLTGHIMSPTRMAAVLSIAAALPLLKTLHTEGNYAIGNAELRQVSPHALACSDHMHAAPHAGRRMTWCPCPEQVAGIRTLQGLAFVSAKVSIPAS